MSEFPYFANATLDDGQEVVFDLEQRGWADPIILARTVRWSLVPKGTHITLTGRPYPLVSVLIPLGGKPVFRSRVYAGNIIGRSSDQIERKVVPHLLVPAFRVFCIGFKKGKQVVWTWVLPTGDIEVGVGDDSYLATSLRTHLNTQVREEPEPEPDSTGETELDSTSADGDTPHTT